MCESNLDVAAQVRLTIMIEDPREVERRRQLGIEDERGCSKEDMAVALQEVFKFSEVCTLNSPVDCCTLIPYFLMPIYASALIVFFVLFCLFQIFDGKVPEDKLVLRELNKEMLNWPNLEVRSIVSFCSLTF